MTLPGSARNRHLAGRPGLEEPAAHEARNGSSSAVLCDVRSSDLEPSAPREDQVKWCSSFCGRELPLEAFYHGSNGSLYGACKSCHRVRARASFRKRYKSAEFRKARAAWQAAWRNAHKDLLRARRRAWRDANRELYRVRRRAEYRRKRLAA